jgi:hypothetical protein
VTTASCTMLDRSLKRETQDTWRQVSDANLTHKDRYTLS